MVKRVWNHLFPVLPQSLMMAVKKKKKHELLLAAIKGGTGLQSGKACHTDFSQMAGAIHHYIGPCSLVILILPWAPFKSQPSKLLMSTLLKHISSLQARIIL
jgi:hypothetical protein